MQLNRPRFANGVQPASVIRLASSPNLVPAVKYYSASNPRHCIGRWGQPVSCMVSSTTSALHADSKGQRSNPSNDAVDLGCASTTDTEQVDYSRPVDGDVSDSCNSSSTCANGALLKAAETRPEKAPEAAEASPEKAPEATTTSPDKAPEASSVPVPWGLFAGSLPVEVHVLPQCQSVIPTPQAVLHGAFEEKDMLCNSLEAQAVENGWLQMSQMPTVVPPVPRQITKTLKADQVPKVDQSIVNEALEHARIVQAKIASMRRRREKLRCQMKPQGASRTSIARGEGEKPPQKRMEEPQELLAKVMKELERSTSGNAHGSETSPESTETEILAARADALKSICRYREYALSVNARGRTRSAAHFRMHRLTDVFADEVGVSSASIGAKKSGKLRRSRSLHPT